MERRRALSGRFQPPTIDPAVNEAVRKSFTTPKIERPAVTVEDIEKHREEELEGVDREFEQKRAMQVSHHGARDVMLDDDPSRINDAHDFARSAVIEQRKEVWGEALWAAMRDKERIGRALYHNQGVWWPELAPLTPAERGVMLVELRKLFNLPPAKP